MYPQINVFYLLMIAVAVQGSVLVERYALPPPSFQNIPRDPRSLVGATRTLQRLAGGHLRLDPAKNSADYGKNSFASVGKKELYDEKFIGVDIEAQTLGWNQGQWDDGMLMSSAGDGKDKGKKKTAEDDEDKKTLADQVAEGKYGLIQKELFVKNPERPGVLSYSSNPETMSKDNEGSLGGLKNDEVWLAEDHLLVLKGGSFPEKHSAQSDVWPPIDDYKAPPRQVKIPTNPEVPPPFPVRLTDGGPLVFLTPNGSIPAPLFPALAPPAGHGALPHAPFPFPPPGSPFFANSDPKNFTSGQPPFPFAPFPFLPPRDGPFPPPKGFNGSFPFPFPPPGNFGPPPDNLTDLYDEDDPSVYYPPPYSFSYRADNTSKVAAGPLVPGIVLPPPPDFFGHLNQTTNRPTGHAYPAVHSITTTAVPRPKPSSNIAPLTDSPDNSIDITSTPIPPPKSVKITPRPIQRIPDKVVIIPRPTPKKTYSTTPTTIVRPIKTERDPSVTVLHKPVKTTLKPVPVSVGGLYDYNNQNYYETNSVAPSPQPFVIYGPPENTRIKQAYVTSTPVPLKTYYSDSGYQEQIPQIQVAKQNTRIRPEFIKGGQNGKSVASFYFYEEPIQKSVSPAPSAGDYYDGRNYYQNVEDASQDGYIYNPPVQGGFTPSNNYDLRPVVPSREPSPFFFIPQRQGSRTLTQEYFSIQKPKSQSQYVQHAVPVQSARPDTFYDHIANIQQTIDYYTTHKPKTHKYPQNNYREVRQKVTPRPVYQFSFESNAIKQEKSTFRAPKMDDEPFRPMVSYSVPYNIETEPSTAGKFDYADGSKISTESPQPSKYFTTVKPEDYDYEDSPREHKNIVERTTKAPLRLNAVTQPSLQRHKLGGFISTTKNPIDHAYYTKQEEGLFDDITKNYFTIFGQKIEHGDIDSSGIGVTAPLKPEVNTVKTPLSKPHSDYSKSHSFKSVFSNQGQYSTVRPETAKVISLENDTRINYINPPAINPDSEFIPIVNPALEQEYRAKQQQQQHQWKHSQSIQRPQPENNVEIIKTQVIEQPIKEGQQFGADQLDYYRPVVHKAPQVSYTRDNNHLRYKFRGPVAEGRPGSLVAYRLPGDGAHFYFLTPQPVGSQNFKFRSDSLLK